jgi:DNA repair exonuclease SbcCD ATPase subunit
MQITELDNKVDSIISKGVCPECLREVEDTEVIKEKYSKKKELLSNEVDELQQNIDKLKRKISELEAECKEKLAALKDSYNNKKILLVNEANKIKEELNQTEFKIKQLQNLRRMLLDAKNNNNIQALLHNPNATLNIEDIKSKMNNLQQIDEQLNLLQNERQQKEAEYKKIKEKYEYSTSLEIVNKYISQIITEQLLPKYGISMLDLCMDVDEEMKKINHNKLKRVAIEERRKHLSLLQEDLNKIELDISVLQKELDQLYKEDVQLNKEIRCIEFLKNTRALNKYIFSRVSSIINDTLKSFNVLMQVELDVDDNDNVSLYAVNVNGYKVHESFLSAGETVMMKLSLYLVLKKMFDPDFNYLFIDETLDKLDEQNARSVVDLLKNFSNSMSIVVVTHKRDLQSYDIWDNIIDMGN